jgi:acetylglutamate kinase
MTDINGLMRDVKDPDSLISVLTTEDIGPLKEQGVISDGMIPKIDCALHAIESGVERVAMINGMLPHSILVEMLTKGGIGTLVKTGPRTAASA